MFHCLGIVDAHKQPQITEAAFQESAICSQEIIRNWHTLRSFINAKTITLFEPANEVLKRARLYTRLVSASQHVTVHEIIKHRI